jgi:hypothetical protein
MPVWATQWEMTIGQTLPDTVNSYRNAKAAAKHDSALYEAIDGHLSASVEKLSGRAYDPSKILSESKAGELIKGFREKAQSPAGHQGLSSEMQDKLFKLAWNLRIANERVNSANQEMRSRAAASRSLRYPTPFVNVADPRNAPSNWTPAKASRPARRH